MGADLTEAQLGSTADTDSLGGQLKEFPAADLSGANLSDATLTNAYMYDLDMSPLEPNRIHRTLEHCAMKGALT